MPDKRIIAMVTSKGTIELVEEDVPELRAGTCLIEVQNSLISPGSELGSFRGLKAKKDNPDPEGKKQKFGYSNSGIVREVAEGAEEFKPGDRVACIGGGYAQHANWAVVPHNLCVALPDNVTFAQGAYAMLSGTALHCVRRTEPEIGEYAAVVGLGPVGQLTAQILQLSGCYVIGWDMIPHRLEIARTWGIEGTLQIGDEDELAATSDFTCDMGLDAAIFAFGGDGQSAYKSIYKCMKLSPDTHRMGRLVIVGGARVTVGPAASNLDVRRAARTGAGYHDEEWEVGTPYPSVFMHWTTRTNLELCMRLISEGKLNVDVLTTHIIPLEDVEARIDAIIDDPDSILGVVFEMVH